VADASLDITADRPHLEYPFESPPGRGEHLEILPGLHWVRMPLPYQLDHINLWVLDDGDGWAVVDTGTRTDDAVAMWRRLFLEAKDKRPMTRVFVTHMHPDHIGMAGWLTRKFGVRLWMTRLEYLSCRVMVGDTGREAPPEGIEFYRRCGWSDAAIEGYRARFGNFGTHIHKLPDSYRRLRDGEQLAIGADRWRVIVGSGHSPEHACLYCPERKLLISGDQVLPRISSNVSVHPTEPDADPLADWLASLDKLRREVPEDVLVLPAHGDAFRGLHKRLQALSQGQQRALDRLRRRLTEPRRAIDVFGSLFGRPIAEADGHLLGMATGESVACLNHLVRRGEVVVDTDGQGVCWYRMASTGAVSS